MAQNGATGGSDSVDTELELAIAAQENATPQLLSQPGIYGTGVSVGSNGAPEIVIFAESSDLAGIPERVDGFATRVHVTDPIVAQDCTQPTQRCDRPVPPGVSTGHPDITAGTIGAKVVDGAGTTYALSNNHVYANSNNATIGDSVIQPGSFDGGALPNDFLGTLADFEPIVFCQIIFIWLICNDTNTIDAAIAEVAPGDLQAENFCGWAPVAETVPPAQLVPNVTSVKKCGRTTGFTTGTVTAVNATVDVQYGGGIARFTNQIVTTDMSEGGDSGSLGVDTQNRPFGLLYAGSSTATIFNPIDDVLNRFGVSIDEEGPPDNTPPDPPTRLTATGGNAQVSLDWNDNTEPDLASYDVYRATTSGGPYGSIASGVGSSNYLDTTAANGTTYYYVVTATDTSGNESGNSNEASATPTAPPDTTPPDPPTGLTATGGNAQVSLDWNDNTEPDLASYTVYRAEQNGGPYDLIDSGVATSNYLDTTAVNGTTYYYVVTATDTSGNESGYSNEASATPTAPPSGAPFLETGVVTASTGSWTTVNLSHDYGADMVVVASPNYDSGTAPVVTRIRSAAGTTFQLQLDRTAGTGTVSAPVHWMVVEAGVYDVATHGVKMEAVKFTSTATDRRGWWNGQARSYAQSYTTPVVLGQVMTANDPDWSVFWARGSNRQTPPLSTTLWVGKHVGEDPDITRANETIGYVVIEAGTGTLNGIDFSAALGPDTVRGMTNGAPISYNVSGLSSASVAIVSAAAMDGGNGGWPVLYGAGAVSPNSLALGYDEDQANDAERNHTHEQVAYIVFG